MTDSYRDGARPPDSTSERETIVAMRVAMAKVIADNTNLRLALDEARDAESCAKACRDLAGADHERAQERVGHLEEALRAFVKNCACRGTGRVEAECIFCRDSTHDHVCHPDLYNCFSTPCIAARALLAPKEGP